MHGLGSLGLLAGLLPPFLHMHGEEAGGARGTADAHPPWPGHAGGRCLAVWGGSREPSGGWRAREARSSGQVRSGAFLKSRQMEPGPPAGRGGTACRMGPQSPGLGSSPPAARQPVGEAARQPRAERAGGRWATEQAGRLSPRRPGHGSPARPASPGPAPRGCSRNTASKLTSRGSRASGGTPPLLPCLGLGQPPAPSWAGVSRLLRMVSGRLRAADRAGAREGHPIADSGHLHHGVRTEVRVCRQTSSANRPGARPGHSRGRRSLEPLGDVSARPRPQDSAAQCPRAGGPITAPKNEPAAGASARRPPGCRTPGH